MSDRLRQLWDFEDLDASERRFREQLEREESDAGRAEVLTQLARVHSLRDDFDGCARLLAEAEPLASTATAQVRVELERGRMLRSSGDGAAALPVFESAYARALDAGEPYLAGDAAHMCAISVPEAMEEWTRRGLDLAAEQPDGAYWAGPLLNNLGWHQYEAGRYDEALETFERALEVRRRDPGNPQAIRWAEEAVEEARQAVQAP